MQRLKQPPAKKAEAKGKPGPKTARPTRPITLTLDEETIAKARTIGDGNVSDGVRIAVAKMRVAKEN